MNKCCCNCNNYLNNENCSLKGIKILGWDMYNDFCSKYKEKEASEVEKLANTLNKLKVQEGEGFKTTQAKYVIKNYVSKERLIEHLTSQDEPYPIGEVFISRKKIMNFIEEQTK